MHKKLMFTLALVLTLIITTWAQAEIPQVFLVQNSGWMEPFYTDPQSQFRPLVQAIILAAAGQGEVLVAEFNQSVAPKHKSPQLVYQGRNARLAAQMVEQIGLVHKPGGVAWADTDFAEAVFTTATEFLHGRSALIWIITNNKNSPNNEQDTAKVNRIFYSLIHDEPTIKRVLAYPLMMPVHGQHYDANGLMIYALAYGDAADALLDRVLAAGLLSRIITEQPARLKPLDRQSVTFEPDREPQAEVVRYHLGQDNQTLVLEFGAEVISTEIHVRGSFRDEFYPYSIDRAQLRCQLVGPNFVLPLAVNPTELVGLKPGGKQPVSILVTFEEAGLPPLWSLDAVPLMGTDHVVSGRIDLVLERQQLVISPAFLERMDVIFPSDPLPEVFVPGAESAGSTVSWPVEVHVRYPLYPLLLAGGFGLGVVAAVLAAGLMLMKPGRYSIRVPGSGNQPLVDLRPFGSRTLPLEDRQGRVQQVTIRRGLFGTPRVVNGPDGIEVFKVQTVRLT